MDGQNKTEKEMNITTEELNESMKELNKTKEETIEEKIETEASVKPTQEQLYLGRIREKFTYYILLALGFGVLFTICFYDFFGNFNGVLYPVFVAGLYIFSGFALRGINKSICKRSYYCIIGSILLAFSSFVTMNWLVVFFNTLGIMLLFTIFLCKQFYQDNEWGLFEYVLSMVSVWLRAIGGIRFPFIHGTAYFRPKSGSAKKIKSVTVGILLAVVFLSIVLPLLAGADMVFEQMLSKICFSEWGLFSGTWVRYVILTVIGMLLFYGMVCSFSHNHDWKLAANEKEEATSVIVMTGIIAIVYVLFCFLQCIYLFGNRLFELPVGITYASYARQGFFQLLFVALINTATVLFCLHVFEEKRMLKGMLATISGCTFIMIASAVYRMLLYVGAYHLTFLRVLVLWFLAVLTIIMAGISYAIFHSGFRVERFLFFTIFLGYLVFSFIRPDYLIASYNISNMQHIEEDDLYYLLHLSVDATPVIAKITPQQLGYDTTEAFHSSSEYHRLSVYYYDVAECYDGNIRTFQLSRYHARLTAKKWLEEN